MSDVFGSIEPGSNIRIQRSDGRIHAAVVSGLNPETHSLTVEWFEKGDTKGKEIEASIVKELNSEFFRNDNAMRRANSKTDMPNDSQHTSKNHAIPTAVSKRKPRIAKENIPLHSENDHISGKEENNDESAPVSARSRDSKIPAIANRRPTSRHASSASVSTPPIVTNAAAPAPAAKQTNINSNIRRKSNCVKEVERLQKERQERRENQNKLKEEKDQLMAGFKLVNQLNSGGNNPNWEFLKMINDYRSQLEFSSLRPDDAVVDHQICVCVRKRPLNGKERKRSEIDVITIPDKQNTLVHEPKVKVDLTKYVENQTFRFDYSFDENSDNKMVYKYTAQPLVNCIFEGGMATCFAYGQTGSGKTHTMGGDFSGKVQECNKGIYAYAATDIFKYNATRYKHYNLMVSASFFEIYSGKVFDLLSNKKRLEVLEDGKQEVHIKGLTEVVVNSVDDVLQLIQLGNHIRTSGTTSMNNHSSRSHAVFQIILRQSNSNNKLHGKLSLIDLAGNERGKDTISSDRVTRFEGAEINKSLLALKECIRALGRNGAHLPFRASKLTQVLRDSFIGDNARTCMIAMISPCFSSCEHTLNTLRYANRVKELGAIDPLENRKLDRIEENNDSGSVIDTSNISDLDMIRTNKLESTTSTLSLLELSVNDDDVDENWYEMIPLADELKELEEKVIDQHRDLVRHMQSKLDTHIRLLESSDTVEYDVEDYVSRLDNLLDSVLDKAMRVKEEVTEFRMKMKQEEETAQAISVRNKNRKH